MRCALQLLLPVQSASSMSDRDGGLFRPPARMQPVRRELAVEELNGHRALSDGRPHALDGTVSNVAGRKNPWKARLEEKRAAIGRPRVVAPKICSCEDETVRVPLDLWWQPLGVRSGSDHKEEPISVDGLLASLRAVMKHQVLEPPFAPAVDDLGPETDPQIRRRLHLADQVVRHPCLE